jgi:hypothetical protein
MSEASVARESSAFGAGCWSGTATARRRFAFWKAPEQKQFTPTFWPLPPGDQSKVSILEHSWAGSGGKS